VANRGVVFRSLSSDRDSHEVHPCAHVTEFLASPQPVGSATRPRRPEAPRACGRGLPPVSVAELGREGPLVVRKAPRLGASRKGRPPIARSGGGYPRQPSGRIAPLAPVQRRASPGHPGLAPIDPYGADDNGLLDRLDDARTDTSAERALASEAHHHRTDAPNVWPADSRSQWPPSERTSRGGHDPGGTAPLLVGHDDRDDSPPRVAGRNRT
jgi:hypothetical protein